MQYANAPLTFNHLEMHVVNLYLKMFHNYILHIQMYPIFDVGSPNQHSAYQPQQFLSINMISQMKVRNALCTIYKMFYRFEGDYLHTWFDVCIALLHYM